MPKIKKFITDLLVITVGVGIYSAALTVFLVPNEVSPGGVTGLAVIAAYLTRIPVGILTAIFNLPLLVWGKFRIGGRFIVLTILSTALLSAALEAAGAVLPAYHGDRLLAAVLGGGLGGAGLAIVLLRGSSTGGVDIAAKIINGRFPFISVGNVVMLFDLIVTVAATVAYRNPETALYTSIAIFASGKIMDTIIYGADKSRVLLILSDRPDEMASALMSSIHRGVTLLDAHGGYRRGESKVVMCALSPHQAAKAKNTIRMVDEAAFVIALDANRVYGNGFDKK